jgi:NAD(P)-dependent dehydrogenase (short-subunit alcohol dehydrogenase family)
MANTMDTQESKPLTGKVALITGASRGLGKAMALELGAAGAAVILVGRDRVKLDETASEAAKQGARAAVFVTDVSVEAQVLSLQEQATAQFGRVDILVNNAGVNLRKPLVNFTLEEWHRVMDANLTSVFLMCRAFVPLMRGRDWGRIINLTSIMSHVSLPGRTAYSASKSGLLGFTRALAQELAPDGITVVGISPGPFATELNTALINDVELNRQFLTKIPMGRWGRPEEIGKLARFLCSDDAGFITGTDILIDGGWTAQ